MFRFFSYLDGKSRYYLSRRKSGGQEVSATVPPYCGRPIQIEFEHHITEKDAEGGEVLPRVYHKHEPGSTKRSLSIVLSLDEAEQLCRVLKPAVKLSRSHEFHELVFNKTLSLAMSFARR